MCVYGGGSILLSMSFQVKSILNSSLVKGTGKRQNTSWEKAGQVRKYRNRLTKLQNSHATIHSHNCLVSHTENPKPYM